MKLDEDLWLKHQYQVLVSFVHHLAYYRLLKSSYDESGRKNEFWTRTIDAHLLSAIIDWCMVFGVDKNEVHWKKVITDEVAHNSFRLDLLKAIGLTRDQWDAYWSDMTTFRNDFAAHRTAEPALPCVPNMDTALLVVTTYDDWVRSNAEPSLKTRYDELMLIPRGTFAELIKYGP